MLDAAVTDCVSVYLYRQMQAIAQDRPTWLTDAYRELLWHHEDNTGTLLAALMVALEDVLDRKGWQAKLQQYLSQFLAPDYFSSAIFSQNLVDIEQMLAEQSVAEPTRSVPPINAIAILLLDIENVKLTAEDEQILADCLPYPLGIKIAFGNWRTVGKKDLEFHRRNYHMIHVPGGKNSADMQMTALGSSIFLQYPNAKAVMICSADRDLNHLANHLRTHGLAVFSAMKTENKLIVTDQTTGQFTIHAINAEIENTSLQQCVEILKEVMRAEYDRTKNPWIKLSRASQLFSNKTLFSLAKAITNAAPGSTPRDLFISYPQAFQTFQSTDQREFYVALSEIVLTVKPLQLTEAEIAQLSDVERLEYRVVGIVNELAITAATSWVKIESIATKFNDRYEEPIRDAIKSLEMGYSYRDFLQACTSLELIEQQGRWYARLKPQPDDRTQAVA